MPMKSPHACNKSGCKEITNNRFCDAHQRQYDKQYEDRRGSAAERGYDGNWQKLRDAKLAQDPLCERCMAKKEIKSADLVHHKDRNPQNRSWENLESLCNDCHEAIHGANRFGKNKLDEDQHEPERWGK